MSTPCRLIVDPPADGAWNMAVDEALLANVAKADMPTLRFYQWQRPTLSLGYFQRVADRAQHPASREADLVRRLSGGGAILHDREVTYSLAVPRSHPLASKTQALYRTVHEAVLQFLSGRITENVVDNQLSICDSAPSLTSSEEPFLCFQRRSRGDVLWQSSVGGSPQGTHKIVGSAQRRRRGAVLQHGSVLLGRSALAPELPGFSELSKIELSPEDAIKNLSLQIANSLQLALQSLAGEHQLSAAKVLNHQKYSSPEWTERR